MKKRWDEALRSLARRTPGPYRALGYGVIGTPEEVPERSDEIRRDLISLGFPPASRTVVDVASLGSGASDRPRFRAEVLEWIERSEVPVSDPAPVQETALAARHQLRALSAELAQFLAAQGSESSGLDRPAVQAPPAPGRAEERAIVVVGRFEDLGADAEAIGAAMKDILRRGAHLLLPLEGIDTRTKEGRGKAEVVLRLSDLKASAARERSLRELKERRSGLEVYGPVPFGFERLGRKLVPVPRSLEAVARARELALRGLSRFEIALALNREERTWKDGTPWTSRRIELVLRNPIYDRARREDIA